MYAVIDDILAPCIVVDIDCYAAQGGDFGGKLFESGVVLPGEREGTLVGSFLDAVMLTYDSLVYASDIVEK